MTGPVVLVPLDGSKSALCALPVARGLAALKQASVRILHVSGAPGPLGKTAATLGLAPADLRGATLEVRAGGAAEAILAAASAVTVTVASTMVYRAIDVDSEASSRLRVVGNILPIAAVANILILLPLLGPQPTWRGLLLASSRSKITRSGQFESCPKLRGELLGY